MAEHDWNWNPTVGWAVATRFKQAPPKGTVVYDRGEDLFQGLMTTGIQAELLAAHLGVIPWITLPNGQKGILTVGGAMKKLADPAWDAEPGAKNVYRAIHENAHRVKASLGQPSPGVLTEWQAATPTDLVLPQGPMGAPDLSEVQELPHWAIAVIVLGAFASLAAAYVTGRYHQQAAADAGSLKDQGALFTVAQALSNKIAAGKKITPEEEKILRVLAQRKPPNPSRYGAYMLAGGLVVGGAGVAVASYYGKKTPRR